MQWWVPGSVQSESAFSFIAVCRSYVHAQRESLCSQAGQYLENRQSAVAVGSWSVSVHSMKPSAYTPCMSAASVSWRGHGSEGWLCRHILPCASRHDFQCGTGRMSMHSYPTAHVGVFVSKELVLSAASERGYRFCSLNALLTFFWLASFGPSRNYINKHIYYQVRNMFQASLPETGRERSFV